MFCSYVLKWWFVCSKKAARVFFWAASGVVRDISVTWKGLIMKQLRNCSRFGFCKVITMFKLSLALILCYSCRVKRGHTYSVNAELEKGPGWVHLSFETNRGGICLRVSLNLHRTLLVFRRLTMWKVPSNGLGQLETPRRPLCHL